MVTIWSQKDYNKRWYNNIELLQISIENCSIISQNLFTECSCTIVCIKTRLNTNAFEKFDFDKSFRKHLKIKTYTHKKKSSVAQYNTHYIVHKHYDSSLYMIHAATV